MPEPRIAVLDVDGTLVDTNYQHALAWYRAFRSLGETFPIWRIHRLIGMGGDRLIDEVAPLPGAREFIAELRRRGHRVVLASSGKPQHVDYFLDLLDVRDLAEAWTSSEDVDVEAAKNAGMPAVVVRSGG